MANKIEIKVLGMSCSHCEQRINAEISKIDGVKTVKANAKKGIVLIKSDVELSVELIKDAIVTVGFEV